MTLTPIENEFSKKLLDSLSSEKKFFDLSLEAPSIDLLPPKVLRKEIDLKFNPEQEISLETVHGWHIDCFSDLESARRTYPQIKAHQGKPWEMFNFLNSNESSALFDFSHLGSVILSKTPLPAKKGKDRSYHLIPLWLDYALGPELWGGQGKWTRFHQELNEILQTKDLLIGQSYPGYYPLKPKAKSLEQFGFHGSSLDNHFLLVLPWSFPLSALQKLKQVIQQEF